MEIITLRIFVFVFPFFIHQNMYMNSIHTYGGSTQPPTGTWELHRIDVNNCIQNTPDWKDYFGDDCSWYEENDMPGCPTYGMDYVGSMGVAFDNCCYCMLDLLDLV